MRKLTGSLGLAALIACCSQSLAQFPPGGGGGFPGGGGGGFPGGGGGPRPLTPPRVPGT